MPLGSDSKLPPSTEARIEKLINLAFKREVIRKVTDVILPLNDGGCDPAFYCVHAIGGVAADFRHMARMLGPEQKFYGIQTPTGKRNAEFISSIKSISQYYVDELAQDTVEELYRRGKRLRDEACGGAAYHSIGNIAAADGRISLRPNGWPGSCWV
jgi:hypothetical protein